MEHLGRIGFSEEQADLMEVAANFCREKSPVEKVRKLMEDERGFDPAVWEEIARLGWLGIAAPEAYGGAGLSLAEVAPVMEQMGRTLMAGPYASTVLAAEALTAAGTEEQKAAWLPKIVEGAPATLALMEKSGAWDLDRIGAQAVLKDGVLHLSGGKVFVADAAAAQVIVVSVLHDGAPALALVEASALPAGALRRETIIDETKRAYELTLDGVSVPESALLDRDKAGAALSRIHLAANLLAAAEMAGGTQAVIDYTIEYLTTRKQFGKLIGSYQALKHPTVDAFLQYEQARSHLYSAAHCFNEQGTGEIATRMAKAQADKAYSYAADRSIQFHGGFGFTYDCDAQLHRRRAIWQASQYGDAAYHRKKLADLLLA